MALLFFSKAKFLTAINQETQRYTMGLGPDEPTLVELKTVTTNDSHFAFGFLDLSSKKFRLPSMYLRPMGSQSFVHLKQVSVKVPKAITNEAMLKGLLWTDFRTDLITWQPTSMCWLRKTKWCATAVMLPSF